ncbi:hypothetical protein LWI29_003825 [Acer saccharum]|uniref:PX domain-containing protein n=1 Tax=Acer saccharum TaxID=4024 RepID=A0AA39SCE3_ACESA|nr:hypothetical protein LWI29_003825 [Acer saccharum]
MNLYALDLSLFDFANFSDPIISHPDRTSSSLISSYDDDNYDDDDDDKSSKSESTQANRRSPPRHRHDGSSPLPLGMDWSSPPRKWDGRDSIWPHDPHTGWSYCVTVPSWILLPNSGGSDPVATYRVQVGIQSPEGITTTRGILRRFSDFLKLLSELKKAFPNKEFPRAPPKRILKMKSRTLLEERRCSLEDWMEKLLSDIDISRSVSVATFLELEAAARSSFHDRETLDAHSLFLFQTNTDASVVAGSSSVASDHGNVSPDGISELGTPRHQTNNSGYFEYQKLDGHVRRLSTESVGSDLSSIRASEISNYGVSNLFGDSSFDHPEGGEASRTMIALDGSDSLFPRDSQIVVPSDQRLKLNRVLNTMQQRLATAKTDTEDLIARLNQEGAVRQFLTTKVKDLEVELETTRENCKENMQQAVLSEKERITQMQWDIEELRKQCLETELKLKYEQAERARAESSKMSLVQENEMLLQDLDVARDQLESLHKDHEELEVKLKADVKLLVKEVKSLRSSQSELKQELGRLMKEKLEVERSLQKEKQRAELANNANSKLLHECEILCNRLQECSVNFLSEEEDKLILDTSSPSDAIDLLTTSDNRIGLLLAEAQLLAQDIEKSMAGLDETHSMNDKDQRSDDELRKMLTHIFVDNARLRMHVNSVIRCALNTCVKSDEEDEEEEETPFRKTVLSKFLER